VARTICIYIWTCHSSVCHEIVRKKGGKCGTHPIVPLALRVGVFRPARAARKPLREGHRPAPFLPRPPSTSACSRVTRTLYIYIRTCQNVACHCFLRISYQKGDTVGCVSLPLAWRPFFRLSV